MMPLSSDTTVLLSTVIFSTEEFVHCGHTIH